MSELEIILSSGVIGGVLSQIGGKLIDKFIHTPKESSEQQHNEIANIDAILDVNNKMIKQLRDIIEELKKEVCFRSPCDIRLSGNDFLDIKRKLSTVNK
jgi:hypothetical protein